MFIHKDKVRREEKIELPARKRHNVLMTGIIRICSHGFVGECSDHRRTGWGGEGAAPPPPKKKKKKKIGGNSGFLGRKRNFGQSQFLKMFSSFFFEHIDIFYFYLKSVL